MSEVYKYIDIDSTRRNRVNYPNPYDFVIPIFNLINQDRSNNNVMVDPVLESAPYTGSNTLRPGQLKTQISIDFFNIKLDSEDSNIDNFYINRTLQIGNVFRTITYYNGTTKIATVSKPFPMIPPSGTIYYTRSIEIYFNTDIGIAEYDIQANLVYSLNILQINPNPTLDFYKGSYIRFTNGPLVGKTTLIQSYVPQGTISTFKQISNYGANTFISTSYEQGFRIISSVFGNILNITLNLISFDTTLSTRDLNIKIRNYSIDGPLELDLTFTVNTNITSPTDITFPVNQGTLRQDIIYIMTLTDVTPTANSTGYIMVFGTVPNETLITYNNMSTYPKHTILSIPNLGGDIIYQQTTSYGYNEFLTPTQEVGFKFISNKTGILYFISIFTIAFETVSSGRIVTLRIREGSGLFGNILFSNNYQINSFLDYEKTQSFYLNNGPYLSSGQTYTLTLEDITAGGSLTGYVNLFGILQDNNNYESFRINVYPTMTISVNSFDILTQINNNSFIGTNTRFGQSISVSGNCKILAAGAPEENNSTGAVYIFTKDVNGAWIQMQRIVGSSSLNNSLFGNSLDLNYDGTILAIGSPGDNLNAGCVFIFKYINNIWIETQKLVGTGSIGNAFQGISISLSEDSSTIAVGANNDNSGIGATWIFNNIGGTYFQQAKLVGTGNIGSSNQCYVDLSSDGNTLAVGGDTDNFEIGATWIFIRTFGVWSQQAKLVGTGYFDNSRQGRSVSLTENGNTLVIGGYLDNFWQGKIGAAWVFNRIDGIWTQEVKLVGSNYINNPQQGAAVKIHKQNNLILIGGLSDNGLKGAVWIFIKINGIWTEIQKLFPSINIGQFGETLFISRDYTIYSGAPITINSQGGTIYMINSTYSNFASPSIPQLLPLTEFGFEIIPSDSGTFNSLTFELNSYEGLTNIRTYDVKVRDGSGLFGPILKSSIVTVDNYLGRTSVTLTMPKVDIISGNTYTITFTDITPSGNSIGQMYLYGIRPNISYKSHNVNIYPTSNFTKISIPKILSEQLISDTIYETLSTSIEEGFRILPLTSGMLSSLNLMISSFSDTGSRTIKMRIREGSGLSGTILYETNLTIQNTLSRNNTRIFFLSPAIGGAVLEIGIYYTITFQDITVGGNTNGYFYIYGINPTIDYVSYNSSIFPVMYSEVPSYLINISPAMPYTDFLGNGLDNIEFNTKAYDNLSTLRYTMNLNTRISFYEIGLEYIIIPNVIFKSGYGGRLSDYPYIYIEFYNDGYKGNLNTLISNNSNGIFAIFKVEIKKNLYSTPSLFYTIKPKIKKQIIAYRSDQDTRVVVKLPDGSILFNNMNDTISPNYPNSLLQLNMLISIRPVTINIDSEETVVNLTGLEPEEFITELKNISKF